MTRRQPELGDGEADGDAAGLRQCHEGGLASERSRRRSRWGRVAALAAVNFVVGTTVGATTVAAGLAVPMAVALTAVLFAGASQLAAVSILAAGGAPLGAWTTAMLINARFVLLGGGIAEQITMSPATRLGAAAFLVDPVALVVQMEDPADANRAYWETALAMFLAWAAGGTLGATGVTRLGNLETFGLDVALPVLLFGLLATGLRNRTNRQAAIGGALVAFVLLHVTSPGMAVLLASSGAVTPMVLRFRSQDGARGSR